MKLIIKTMVLCLCLLLPATVLAQQMTTSEYLFASTSSEAVPATSSEAVPATSSEAVPATSSEAVPATSSEAVPATDSAEIPTMVDEEFKTVAAVETSFIGNGKLLSAETMRIQEEDVMDASSTEEALKWMPETKIEPTAEPTIEPTAEPTIEPTAEPTTEPTAEPTPCVKFTAVFNDGGTGILTLLTIVAFAATGICILQIVRINRSIRKKL